MTRPWQTPLEPPSERVGAATTLFVLLALAAVAGFGMWSWYAKLDIVSVAAGEVTPSSQIQSVQHLEGGIVREVSVREGAEVTAGQPLVVLESVRSGADRDEVQVRVDSLAIDMIRLESEATGKAKLVIPPDLARKHPAMAARAATLFETKRRRYGAEIARQKELIIQRTQEIKELQARIRNTRNSLKLTKQQVKLSKELLEENLTVEFEHVKLLREESALVSRLEEDLAGLPRARAGLKEAKLGIEEITQKVRAEAREELKEAARVTEELSQRLRKFEDSLKRTVLRAPMDGVVKTVHIQTIGGVVKAGEVVVDLVPLDDRLIVEAQLPTQDIGYVEIGQDAVIKLDSPELARFGGLDGSVTEISPDKLVRDDGLPYFRVRIETEKDFFEKDGEKYRLFPGTQVVASIRTGERRVLEYLFDPFIGSMGEALRER